MGQWDDLSGIMDQAVDSQLGDTISYAVDGATFVDLSGFVLDEEPALGQESIDEILTLRKRVKIRKDLIGTPTAHHRLRHARLGPGTFKPMGQLPETQGRYWVFDVQQATT